MLFLLPLSPLAAINKKKRGCLLFVIVFRAWFEIEVGSHAGLVYASNAASRQVKELDSIVLDRINYRNRDEEVVARIFWLVAFERYPFLVV